MLTICKKCTRKRLTAELCPDPLGRRGEINLRVGPGGGALRNPLPRAYFNVQLITLCAVVKSKIVVEKRICAVEKRICAVVISLFDLLYCT